MLARACTASKRELCAFTASTCLWLASSSAAASRVRSDCASARLVSTDFSRACVAARVRSLSVSRRAVCASSVWALSSAACTAARSCAGLQRLLLRRLGLALELHRSAGRRRLTRSACRRFSSRDLLQVGALLLHLSAAIRRSGSGARTARRDARPWSSRASGRLCCAAASMSRSRAHSASSVRAFFSAAARSSRSLLWAIRVALSVFCRLSFSLLVSS